MPNHTSDPNINEKLIQYLMEQTGELKEVMDLDATQIEALYAQAFKDYESGEYQKAMQVFSFLTRVNHLDKRFHVGYGATLQCLEKYTDAINAYLTASLLDLNDPQPTINIGYCLVKIRNYADAKNILRLVTEDDRLEGEQQKWREDAQALLDEIEHLEFLAPQQEK